MALDDDPRLEPATREQWRTWLAENHAAATGVWVVMPRRASARSGPSYEDLVEEGLCFGWVDSAERPVDDERLILRFTPRRTGSTWARSNKERVARLTAAGLMAEAGLRVVAAAKADGAWSALDEVDALVVPDDLAAALAARPPAREKFDAFPPGARRAILYWIWQAKKPETRERRITETAERASRGERAQ